MSGFRGETFEKVIYVAFGGTGDGSSAAQPLAMANGDLMAIPAGLVVQSVVTVVTTAIATASAVLVGDDDDPDGFCTDANITDGTIGAYGGTGAYIGSGAAKFYPATGKEIKWAQTGTASAGAAAVIVKGFKIL